MMEDLVDFVSPGQINVFGDDFKISIHVDVRSMSGIKLQSNLDFIIGICGSKYKPFSLQEYSRDL